MSRSKRQKPRRPAAKPPAPRVSRRFPIVPLAVALVVGALGLWWWRSHETPPPPTPAAAFDPRRAYREAMVLGQQKKYLESLPALRSVMESDTNSSQLHHDYATAVLNAVHQPRVHLGRKEFAVRSSLERIELVRWALVELVRAERTAREPRELAWAIRTRAQALGAWGFPWEAVSGYRDAEQADTSWLEIQGRAEFVLQEMLHPERAYGPR